MKLRNVLTIIALSISSLGIQAQEIIDKAKSAVKHCMINECVMYEGHKPGFPLAFANLKLTDTQKDSIIAKISRWGNAMSLGLDITTYTLMQDNTLDTDQKRELFLYLLFRDTLSGDLKIVFEKYQKLLVQNVTRALENEQMIDDYISKEKDAVYKEKDAVYKEKDAVYKEKDAVDKTEQLLDRILGEDKKKD